MLNDQLPNVLLLLYGTTWLRLLDVLPNFLFISGFIKIPVHDRRDRCTISALVHQRQDLV